MAASPDGTALAVATGSELWVWDKPDGNKPEFSRIGSGFTATDACALAWSPDATRLAFVAGAEVMVIGANGATVRFRLLRCLVSGFATAAVFHVR